MAAEAGRRSFWLRHLHQWHWVSSAVCLIGMLLFAATGITLNHAADIGARPVVQEREGRLPAPLLAALPKLPDGKHPLPEAIRRWLAEEWSVEAGTADAEWSAGDIYLALPRPGGDAWVSIDRGDGGVQMEESWRGWISYFNDLHKGRSTGLAWSWFIDVFAVACLVFCITGLFLLHLHAGNRPFTWPLVGLGLVVPLLLAILFLH
jgi:hypothetical protein